MPQITLEVSEDDFRWLRYRAEALGLPSADALIAMWVAADHTEEAEIETTRALVQAGMESPISDRSLMDILQDYRARLAAA